MVPGVHVSRLLILLVAPADLWLTDADFGCIKPLIWLECSTFATLFWLVAANVFYSKRISFSNT